MTQTLEDGLSSAASHPERTRGSSIADTEVNHDDEDSQIASKPSWISLFRFTNVPHLPVLFAAIVLTLAAGAARIVFALYLGKLFQTLSQFGIGAMTGNQLMERIRDNTYILLILGGLTWVLSAGFLFCWILFAELQVRRAGKALFGKLLIRDIMWFDMRKEGIGSFLSDSQK